MPQHIVVTKRQRAVLKDIKSRLADHGYYIYPVARTSRRTKHDFIAAHKDRPQQFLIVRPTLKGFISIVPFVLRILYREPLRIISSLQKKAPKTIRWSGRQLRSPERPDWWRDYFPNQARKLLTIA